MNHTIFIGLIFGLVIYFKLFTIENMTNTGFGEPTVKNILEQYNSKNSNDFISYIKNNKNKTVWRAEASKVLDTLIKMTEATKPKILLLQEFLEKTK